jgi:hypothetical protein
MLTLQNNATNSLRFAQVYIGANDQKWLLIQKTNNVDNTIFNFRNGNIAVGTFSNPAYRIDLVGDINITGNYRVNGTIYRPNAVLADTATKLATIRTIAGADFDGTANINIDYFALNNKPLTVVSTTTNFQLTSGYNLFVSGNVGVGTTTAVANVLQVGSGARLRIANGATDYTIIETNDTDGATNTQIIISGNTRTANDGNIQNVATATNGSHLFYTTSTSIRMTINSSGVNINNDLGVSGRVGIATAPHATYALDVNGTSRITGNTGIGTTPHSTYRVDVNGTLNATSVLIGGNAITGSKWTSSGTNIYDNAGNVAIGTTDTSTYKLRVEGGNIYTTNPIYFNNNYYGGGADVACNKISMFGQGSGQYGFGVASYSTEYFSAQYHRFYYGLNIGGATRGTQGMVLDNNNLSVGGSICATTTIQSSGAYYFPNNIWNKTNDGLDRFILVLILLHI